MANILLGRQSASGLDQAPSGADTYANRQDVAAARSYMLRQATAQPVASIQGTVRSALSSASKAEEDQLFNYLGQFAPITSEKLVELNYNRLIDRGDVEKSNAFVRVIRSFVDKYQQGLGNRDLSILETEQQFGPERRDEQAKALAADLQRQATDPATGGGMYGLTGIWRTPALIAQNVLPGLLGPAVSALELVGDVALSFQTPKISPARPPEAGSIQQLTMVSEATQRLNRMNPMYGWFAEGVSSFRQEARSLDLDPDAPGMWFPAFMSGSKTAAAELIGHYLMIGAPAKLGRALVRPALTRSAGLVSSVMAKMPALARMAPETLKTLTSSVAGETLTEVFQMGSGKFWAGYALAAQNGMGHGDAVAVGIDNVITGTGGQELQQLIMDTVMTSAGMGMLGLAGGAATHYRQVKSAMTAEAGMRSGLNLLKKISEGSQEAAAVGGTADAGLKSVTIRAAKLKEIVDASPSRSPQVLADMGIRPDEYHEMLKTDGTITVGAGSFVRASVKHGLSTDSIAASVRTDRQVMSADEAREANEEFISDYERIQAETERIEQDLAEIKSIEGMSSEDAAKASMAQVERITKERKEGKSASAAQLLELRRVISSRVKETEGQIWGRLRSMADTLGIQLDESVDIDIEGRESKAESGSKMRSSVRRALGQISEAISGQEGTEMANDVSRVEADVASAEQMTSAGDMAESVPSAPAVGPIDRVAAMQSMHVEIAKQATDLSVLSLAEEAAYDIDASEVESVQRAEDKIRSIFEGNTQFGKAHVSTAQVWAITIHNIAKSYFPGKTALQLIDEMNLQVAMVKSIKSKKGTAGKALASMRSEKGNSILSLTQTLMQNINPTAAKGMIMHEMWHFLHAMMRIAADSSPAAAADLKIIDDAAAAALEADGIEVTRSHINERAAIWFEKWPQLDASVPDSVKPIFERVKRWVASLHALLDSYKSANRPGLKKGDRYATPPEKVRAVFQQLFREPSPLEIGELMKDAETHQGLDPMFFSIDDMAMAIDEDGTVNAERAEDAITRRLTSIGVPRKAIEDYVQSWKNANAASVETYQQQIRSKLKRKRVDAWRKKREQIADQVRSELDSDPAASTLTRLQTNTTPSGRNRLDAFGNQPMKLDHASAVSVLGEAEVERLNGLGEPITSPSGGLDMSVAAIALGMNDVSQLASTLREATYVQTKVMAEASRRTTEQMGAPYDERQLEDDVQTAMMQPAARENMLRLEHRILLAHAGAGAQATAKAILSPVASRGTLLMQAKAYMDRQSAENIRPQEHLANAKRLAKESAKAYWKGDIQLAADLKAKQITAHHYYMAAIESRNMMIRVRERARQLSRKPSQIRLGKANMDILGAVNTIIETAGMAKPLMPHRSKAGIAASLDKIASASGIQLPDYASLRDPIGANGPNVEQYRSMGKVLYALSKLASDDMSSRHAEAEAKVADNVNYALASMRKTKGGMGERTLSGSESADSIGMRIRKKLASFFASSIKMEILMAELGGGPNGGMYKVMFQPFNNANAEESTMIRAHRDRMSKLKERLELSDEQLRDLHKPVFNVPNSNIQLSKWQIMIMFAYQGTAHSKQALLDGYPGLNQDIVNTAINSLSKVELQYMDGIMKEMHSYWPRAQKMHKNLTGITPESVVATPIETVHGTFDGGYFPLAYDHIVDAPPKTIAGLAPGEDVTGVFGPMSTTAMTKHNYTKERTGSQGKSLRLDPSIINQHILEVIHDVTHREAVVDAYKVFAHPRFAKEVVDAVGRPIYDEIGKWIIDIAGSARRPQLDALSKVSGRLRSNFVVAVLGMNVGTGISQLSGITLTTQAIGARWTAKGMAHVSKQPFDAYRFATERSAFMRDRMSKGYERDVRQLFERNADAIAKVKGWNEGVQQAAMQFIAGAQMLVDLPTWHGAYGKAMAGEVAEVEAGDERASAEYADYTVRTTQTAVDTKDLSGIQRSGNPWLQWFTAFYSFFNLQLNLQLREAERVYQEGSSAIPTAAANLALIYASAHLDDLLRGRYDLEGNEDDDWMKRLKQFGGTQLTYPFEGIVGVRDLVGLLKSEIQHGSPFGSIPAMTTLESMYELGTFGPRAIFGDKPMTATRVRKAAVGLGVVTGLPMLQLYRMGSGIYNIGKDYQGNPAASAYRVVAGRRAFGGEAR